MVDYTPVYAESAQPITFTASTAVTGGQPVEVTGNMQVGPAAAGSVKCVGIAAFDCPAGQKVTVHTPRGNVEEVAVEAAVAAGDHLQVGASGKVKKFTVGTDPEPARIGLCIQGQGTAGSVCRYLTV